MIANVTLDDCLRDTIRLEFNQAMFANAPSLAFLPHLLFHIMHAVDSLVAHGFALADMLTSELASRLKKHLNTQKEHR